MNSDFLSSFLIFLFLFIVDEFMFKEGVQDQLDKLDRDDDVRPRKVTPVLLFGCFEGGSRKNDKRSIEEEVA